MTAAPLHIAGTRTLLDPLGALYWPDRHLLAVADLHLEKGTAAAMRGQLVPPWDTRTTLERLTLLLRRYRPQTLIALGDSFHDSAAAARMQPADATRLHTLTAGLRMIWVLGNHDPALPAHLPGTHAAGHNDAPLTFRHIAQAAPPIADGWAEICGHHHPKAAISARSATVTRPCFVTDGRRIMLPAFGAYAGGLDVRDPTIGALFPRGGRVFLLGQDRLFSFALDRHKPRAPVTWRQTYPNRPITAP
jgi:DNA ligase-associated metallophosphoesterase